MFGISVKSSHNKGLWAKLLQNLSQEKISSALDLELSDEQLQTPCYFSIQHDSSRTNYEFEGPRYETPRRNKSNNYKWHKCCTVFWMKATAWLDYAKETKHLFSLIPLNLWISFIPQKQMTQTGKPLWTTASMSSLLVPHTCKPKLHPHETNLGRLAITSACSHEHIQRWPDVLLELMYSCFNLVAVLVELKLQCDHLGLKCILAARAETPTRTRGTCL